MKQRMFFVLAFLLSFLAGQAQLAPEKVYNYSLTSIRINQTDYRYFLMDVPASQCRIYNTDHTLWKTIPISLPSGYYLSDIKFVTQNLFNSDASVELWYSAYEWVATGTSTGYYRYISKVISETGTVLANVTGGAYAYVIQTGSNTYKLAVYAYDNSVTPGTVATHIFSLPDPLSAAEFVAFNLRDPYPNPAGNYIDLPLDPAESGLLQVFSVSGRKVAENWVWSTPVYRLNTRSWSPGIYTYRMVVKGISSEAKQFAVQ